MSEISLYRNGSVYSTVDPYATAMIVENGQVGWIGGEAAADSLQDARMNVIDLDGALITPAFVDSHVHVTETAHSISGLDLGSARSVQDVLDAVSAHAAQHERVVGRGWDESGWDEARVPSAEELERASGGKDVYLTRVDAHSGIASAGFAAKLGLPTDTGSLTGEQHVAARQSIANYTAAERAQMQKLALEHFASRGFAAVVENAAPHIAGREDLESLAALTRESGESLPTVYALWGELARDEQHARELVDSFGPGVVRGLAGDLRIDGSLGSRTAALREPYVDAPGETGQLYVSADDAAAHFVACTLAGVQGGFHVIGERGLDVVIEALEKAAGIVGIEKLKGANHRLEHVEMADDAHIEALASFGVTVSMQPLFDAYWGVPGGMYEQRVGAERASIMNRVGTMLAAGIPVTFGSDAPVTNHSPWETAAAAFNLHASSARISSKAAFIAQTRAGYRAVRESNPLIGQLGPSSPATFAIWEPWELSVQTPDERVSAWSTDTRAGTPVLPTLENGSPECLRTVKNGVTLFDKL